MSEAPSPACPRPPAGSPGAFRLGHAHPSGVPFPLWYRILRLRCDVFVVEQECAYPELDDLDLRPGTEWWWAADAAGQVLASVRVLESDGSDRIIGRVVAARTARGTGAATAVFGAALRSCGGVDVRLGAQLTARRWYERFGFVEAGDVYVEDGIPHVPMLHAGSSSLRGAQS